MRLVELLTDRFELSPFERADSNPAPRLTGADQRRIHQLQHRPLAERMGMIFVRRRYSRRFVVRITRR